MENNVGRKCLCTMQLSNPFGYEVRYLDSEIIKFVRMGNRVWKCFSNRRQWKENFECLMYRFVRARFFESSMNRFIFHVFQNLPGKPRNFRFLFRPSLIVKTATGRFLLWNQTGELYETTGVFKSGINEKSFESGIFM